MSALSVILNVVTLLIVFYAMMIHGEALDIERRSKPSTASEVMDENLTDPLVVGRGYFRDTERFGRIGKFTGNDLGVPEDNWADHRLAHEES
ncbi:hypothetical protein DSLPV1_074 [Dishui lake phycodnavirus 1]|uniref:hypothetical protein n=1 Tax=Dishui lake phycodnavirus 1 TaxID=2079134 RepID=UPI000CD69277|nr:hypothetical protein C5Y57_gp074 [Dishui lake phycodnavirus 1]AUT19045.1 hypothetical protein DSLPV1_074 [Dishui lake phycodnavirus 1]